MIGELFVFTLLGAFAADNWTQEAPCPPAPPPPAPTPPPGVPAATEATIAEVKEKFLPSATEAIEIIKQKDPRAPSSWKKMAGYLPGLTESVAMFYAMVDPKVPLTPKLTIAGSLLYFISPIDLIPDTIPFVGQLDDLGVLLSAARYVAGHIDEGHIKQAQDWLRSQGVEPTPVFDLGFDPAKAVILPIPTTNKKGIKGRDVIDAQPPAPPPVFPSSSAPDKP